MIDLALEHLEAEREHGVIYAVGEDEDTGEPNWILPARYMDRFEAWLQEQFDADQRSLEALKAQFSGAGEGESQVAESGGATATPPGRLDDLVAVWEQQRKPARSSRHDMKTAVARFQRVNGPLPYREISAEHVRRFKDDLLRDESIKNATKQKLWGMVRSLMAVAMLERQREGIAKAKAEGKYRGRAPTARRKAAEVKRMKADGVPAAEIAARLGIGRASVYRVLREVR